MGLSPAQWEAELASHLGYPVRVEYTRARRYPVQLRPARRDELAVRPELRHGWVVRLHGAFGTAPPEVREALAAWIRAGRRARRASALLDSWTEETLRALPTPPPRRASLRPAGEVHDLGALTLELLADEFHGEFDGDAGPPAVTWGRRGRSRARSRLQLGSYQPGSHLVRIHPVLDQAAVPAWFVRYVLFHEHLHAAVPSETDEATGRTAHHGPRFRVRERAYADLTRALAWERLHLPSLLRSARSGSPLRRSAPLTVEPGASSRRPPRLG